MCQLTNISLHKPAAKSSSKPEIWSTPAAHVHTRHYWWSAPNKEVFALLLLHHLLFRVSSCVSMCSTVCLRAGTQAGIINLSSCNHGDLHFQRNHKHPHWAARCPQKTELSGECRSLCAFLNVCVCVSFLKGIPHWRWESSFVIGRGSEGVINLRRSIGCDGGGEVLVQLVSYLLSAL